MNRKGSYAAVIALVAVVVVVVVAARSSAVATAEGEKGYAGAAAEVKREWQNVRYLLDKSTSDALADGSHATGETCSIDTVLVTEANNYLEQAIADTDFNCGIVGSPSADTAGGNVTVSVDFYCSMGFGNSFIKYQKSTTFEKQLGLAYSSPDCLVDVLDTQSGLCEVDKILGGLCAIP